jgi:hypothetical protein
MATTAGERLTMEPNWNSHQAGLSMTLTGTPAARAASKNAAASASVSASATAISAPEKMSSPQSRR